MSDRNTSAILLDIEGTTTPCEFVYKVLFPFAHQQVKEFIQLHRNSADLQADIDELRVEYLADSVGGSELPAWRDNSDDSWLESVTAYIHWQMQQDRKSTALKSVQGKIWEAGYLSGALLSQVYPDVPAAFARWREQEKQIHIYSSGSILAQKLLFAHTSDGDLSAYISDYFDTTTGAKRAHTSYQAIAEKVALPASEILFLSDVTAELDAARDADMLTTLCVRPGNAEVEPSTHPIVQTLAAVFP
jgi:enolase-phosphatase E1